MNKHKCLYMMYVCMYAYVYNNINKEKKKEKQTQEKIYEDTGYTL